MVVIRQRFLSDVDVLCLNAVQGLLWLAEQSFEGRQARRREPGQGELHHTHLYWMYCALASALCVSTVFAACSRESYTVTYAIRPAAPTCRCCVHVCFDMGVVTMLGGLLQGIVHGHIRHQASGAHLQVCEFADFSPLNNCCCCCRR